MELSYFVLLLIDESAVCVPVSVQRFSVLTDNKCQCFKMAAQKTRLLIHTFIFLIVTSTFNTDDLNSAVSTSEWHTARTWWTRSPSEVLIRGIVVLISWSIVLHWWLCVCVCVVVVVVIEAAVVLRLRPHCDVITGSGGLIVCSSKQKHRSVLGSRSF